MRLGFIGVGNISSDVIYGIFNSKISIKKIILSPRNKKIKSIKKKFRKIEIAKNNQEVIDKIGFFRYITFSWRKNITKINFKKTINNKFYIYN